jgi:galactosylgalactosylxylosylprotein 3-beta-glucuronosyltransferase 2
MLLWNVGLAALMHTLSLVPGPVTWIVIEAGGVTNETAYLLTQAHVHRLLHLGFGESMTPGFEEQPLLETRLRIEGLRYYSRNRV